MSALPFHRRKDVRLALRYAAAMASLEKMLTSYGAGLSAKDKAAAEQALKELREKVKGVVFVVTPKEVAWSG